MRIQKMFRINGINIALSEPDALDRSIMIEVNRISRKNRRQETEILEQFKIIKPKLLAYIFDILTKVLQIKPTVKLDDLPRMADFTIWGEAIARAMGYNSLQFVNAYFDNIGKQNVEAIENHPLGRAIVKYFDKLEEEGKPLVLEGSPLEMLEMLEVFSEQKGRDPDNRLWPKAPNIFTRRLREIQSNLLEGCNIEVEIGRNTKRNGKKANTATIRIWKAPFDSESISSISTSPTFDNSRRKNEENVGDTMDIEKTQIPPTFENTSSTNTNDNAIEQVTLGDGKTENGFTNENQLKERSLEESPFRKLIRRSGPGNIYYQCILHPKAESIHLEEILRHFSLKPEEHHAELQRLSEQEEKKEGQE